jgi:hypothetical protein
VHTHEIQVAGGREAVSEIRRQLFVFSEVLDVLATSRADSLVVVFSGRARPADWNGHLRDLGYQLHPRHAKPSGDAIAPNESRPASPALDREGSTPVGVLATTPRHMQPNRCNPVSHKARAKELDRA